MYTRVNHILTAYNIHNQCDSECSSVTGRCEICLSASRHHLVVLRHNLSTYGRRAFAVAGPAAWNSLSDDLRDPALSTDSFRCLLKTCLFSENYGNNALQVLYTMHYINLQLTYLPTYLSLNQRPSIKELDKFQRLTMCGPGNAYFISIRQVSLPVDFRCFATY